MDPFKEREPVPIETTAEVMAPDRVLQALTVPKPDVDAITRREIDDIEERIYKRHSGVVDAIGDWATIDPDASGPPTDWYDRGYSPEELATRFRVAQAANMTKAKAPIGLTLSVAIHGNILKARAGRNLPQSLNIMMVKMTVGEPEEFETVTVKAEERR